MSDLEMKSFGPFEIKSEDRGEVVAIVATLGVVDKDGDVILPGSVPPEGAKVKLSSYGHNVITEGKAPVGKGLITEQGDKLMFSGKFYMTTERGRDAFATVKEDGEDGQWSFGFPKNVKTVQLTDEWRTKGARRIIAGLDAIEASPVFVGAGWGTGTLLTKAAEPEADGDPAPVSLESPGPIMQAIMEVSEGAQNVGELAAELVAAEPAEPVESAEEKAAREADLAYKAARAEMVEEMNRVQRALHRNGLPSIPEVRLEDAA